MYQFFIISYIAVGSATALSLGMMIFGYIGQYLHWEYIFHLTSLCGIIWTVFWYFLIYDYPDKHPTISIEEKTKIQSNMKEAVTDDKVSYSKRKV